MADDPKPISKQDYRPAGAAAGSHGIVFGGKSQSKYDVGSLPGDLGDLNAVRAKNQGFWDGLGNTGVNLITTLFGQAVETIGSITDPVMNWFNETDLTVNEGLTGVGADIQHYGQDQFPTYYDPNKGFNMDYIFSHLPSLVSTAAMLLPGYGVARGAGLAARALRMGALGEKILATGAGAVAMRHAENWMESAQVYNQIMQEGAQGLNPDLDPLGYEEIQNAAKTASAMTYKMNWANLGFDVLQMAAILKPIKGLSGWTNTLGKESKFAQVMDYGYKVAAEKGILANSSKLSRIGLGAANIFRPFALQTTEGIEEAWNDISQREGYREGLISQGAIQDDGSSFTDRLGEYTKSWQMWDSFIWGVLGGVAFQAGGEKLNRMGAKAGWWNDTTKRSQMLADLKQRSDIVTKGYRDLADPKLTEYDKEVVKGNMLFNLVSTNKGSESLDMLIEDLSNPKMVKKFSEMMGLNEQDTLKELAIMQKDMEFVNERIDYYTGDTMRSWLGHDPSSSKVGIDQDDVVTTPGTVPFTFTATGKKVPFVYDQKAAQFLAYNDYASMVKDRMNGKANVEMQQLQQAAFAGTEHEANSQEVFTTVSEIAALHNIVQREKKSLAERKEKKLSDIFINAAQMRVDEAEKALKRRQDRLTTFKEVMDYDAKEGITDTPFNRAYNYAVRVLGADGTTGKYAGLKAMTFSNLLDKQEAITMNKEVLKDPKKFVQDYVISDTSARLFEDMKKEQEARQKQEQESIDAALGELEKDTNKVYADALKRHADALDESLARYTTPAEKEAYLRAELDALQKDFNKYAEEGKFPRKTMAEFTTGYDKDLHSELKARQNALTAALAPYEKAKQTTQGVAPVTKPGAKAGSTAAVPLIKEQFEPGTPGHYYQGLVRIFGEDGKGGIWNRSFLEGQAGAGRDLMKHATYGESLEKLREIFDKFIKAKSAKDPNAKSILSEADAFIHETNYRYNDATPEEKLVSDLQSEIQYQADVLDKLDTQLGLPVIETKAWQAIGGRADIGSPIKNAYPEVYAFLEGLVAPYPNLVALDENLAEVQAKIDAELAAAKDAYEKWKAGTYKPGKSEQPVTSDELDETMDQDNDSIGTIAKNPSSVHFTPSDNLFPATHAEKVTMYKDEGKGWETVYANGKQQANPNFAMGNTIYIGPDGKTMNGFIKRGMEVTFVYTGNYRGVNEKAEKEIQILDSAGNLIGWMDTGERLKKVIKTLEKELATTKSEDRKRELEGTIGKYNELIPYYAKVRSEFKNAGDKMQAKVADKVSTSDTGVESGGVRFGQMITTQKDNPVNIDAAFELDTINKPGGPILTIFSDGNFLTWSPNAGRFESADLVYPGIAIPAFAKNPKTISGKGSNNGAVFALVPTNTFDQQGNRIYMSAKQYTRKATNVKLTSDGTYTGQTVAERMLEVITNPDKFSEEFTMLAASVNIQFKKEFKISAPENRTPLLAFFSTENLLNIFNRSIYVYDAGFEKSKIRQRDYSHHIGIDVIKPGDDVKKTAIRFDLSNDVNKKNKYVINLFDANGNFNPTFGQKVVKQEQLVGQQEREELGKLGQAEVSVDVLKEINKRLRDKLTRVDSKLLSRDSTKRPYTAIVFNQGRLIEQQYDSYLHYLSDKQIIESTVTGVNFPAVDPKTKEKKTGRTYFDNQSFWFDINTQVQDKKYERKKPSSKNKSTTATPKKAARKSKPKAGEIVAFPVPDAVKESISLRNQKKIKKVGEGSKSHYVINGERYERVSHLLKGAHDIKTTATEVGNVIDQAIKTAMAGDVLSVKGMSEKAMEQLAKGVQDFKDYLNSQGQKVIGTDVVVYAKVTGADGKTRNIAGETDIMTSDKNGNVFIYDFKSSNLPFNLESYQAEDPKTGESRYNNHREQLSVYSDLLTHMTGEPAAGIGIVPFTVAYTGTKNILVDAVIPYELIIFPDYAFNGVTRGESAMKNFDANNNKDNDVDVVKDPLKDSELDGIDLNMELPFDDNVNFWMSDFAQPSDKPSFIDIGRFRDSNASYYEQKQYENYTTQVMLDALYDHRVLKGNRSTLTFDELQEKVREVLDAKITTYKKLIKLGGFYTETKQIPFTDRQMDDKRRQLEHLKTLRDSLDENDDFIGYGKLGIMGLTSMDIVSTDINMEEVNAVGPADMPYSIRFQENYAVKINPKTTINTQAKIFLSRVPELQRGIKDGAVTFKNVSNLFGINQYYTTDDVLGVMHIEFENVAPERFMDRLAELNANNPIVRSAVSKIYELEQKSVDGANQIRHQLTALMKQRRDMKFLKIETDDKGVASARVVDAARLGVTQNIIKEWENGFRAEFNNLFDLTENNDNLRSTNYNAIPKKMAVTYVQKGTATETAEFRLPADFDPTVQKAPWQTDWLYNQIKAIAEGSTKKRITFQFENGMLNVDGQQLGLSEKTVVKLLLTQPTHNFVFDGKMKEAIDRSLKPTILDQIAASIDYFSSPARSGVISGDPGAPKDRGGYYPVYYKILADQLQRIGIQLSEDPEASWTVLQDINQPLTQDGRRRKFNLYDPRSEDFNRFMVDKIGKLVIDPLMKQNAFAVGQQELMDEDGGEFLETMKTINIETPFGHSLQGLTPFAKHGRSEWQSYTNETIRNIAGDLEYTYTSPNGLSTMMAKLKDDHNGYLQQVAATPMGRYNLFVQNLLRSKDALNSFTLHYIDGGKVDNFGTIEPESLNLAKSHLILWNNYYNNETKTAQRNKGGYITTHSDSSIMPIFNFDKQVLPIQFVEKIEPDGTRQYSLRLTEFDQAGEENQVYKHLYGMYRGELQRIYETYEVWKDINQEGMTDQERISYAFKNYKMGTHFNFRNGKLSRGNGVNLYLFGNTLFEGNNSELYQDSSKSALNRSLVDSLGNFNEGAIKQHFDKFVNRYINELVGDLYNDLLKMGDAFFTITESRTAAIVEGDTKTSKLTANPVLLDKAAASVMQTLFDKNALVVNEQGNTENVTLRNLPIERTYTVEGLMKKGMTEDEANAFIAERSRVRDQDMKASTYNELFMRYLASDFAINHAIFFGSLFSIMVDPAVYENDGTYKSFRDQFEKRMKGPVSPGETSYFAENETVKVIAFEDILNGDIKMEVDPSKHTAIEQEFLNEFRVKFNVQGNLFPARVFDMMAFYHSRPENERSGAWSIIKDRLKDKITDGGSYMSTREWLYRAYRKGDITKQQYFDTLDGYYGNQTGKKPIAAKILKYVLAGNDMVKVGDTSSNIYGYLKHAELPLLPELFKGSVLDEIRKQLDEVEKVQYSTDRRQEPTPGIVLVPKSSFKTGYSSAIKIIDESGVPTREVATAVPVDLNRGWLREQIQSPDDKDKRATITSQGNVLLDLNIPATYKFGKRGSMTFSNVQTGEPVVVYDDDGNEEILEDSGTGISSNVLQNAAVDIFTEMAKRRLEDKIYELGLKREEGAIVVDSLERFLASIRTQSVNQFGMGSIAASYLQAIEENGETILPIPVSFTPAGRRIQSVMLAELKDIFYKFSLPGGAFSQFSAAGLYEFAKDKVKADSQLKSYRVKVHKSKQYDSAEAANRDFSPEEIHKAWDPVTKIVEYKTFEPAEAVIPWQFKDAEGNLLDFDKYCNPDGTPKDGMFDNEVLDFVAFRIPNTGANASARLRAVRFTRPGYGDGIATAPEIVAILGADFDYDKLYSYIYNYRVGKSGKIEKVQSVLHSSQDKQDFQNEQYQRQYAKNKLMKNAEYRELKYKLKQAKQNNINLDDNFDDLIKAKGKIGLEDLADLRITSGVQSVLESMRVMEDEYMNQEGFDKEYAKASIYEKQSVSALENALIDRFNLVLGDFKTLKEMTTPLTSDWVSDQVNDKKITVYNQEGQAVKMSINEVLHDVQFHSITSVNSFNKSRLANSSADVVIGMAANTQISQYQGQRWNLWANSTSYERKYQKGYEIRFNDKNGNIKEEDEVTNKNSSYPGFKNPYKVTMNKKVLFDAPDEGRYRLDRITVRADNGEVVTISTAIRAILQAALDHQKNPLIDKASLSENTLNAANAMIRLGFVDEAVPLLQQEAVNDYVLGVSNYLSIDDRSKRTQVLVDIVSRHAVQYGFDQTRVYSILNSLPDEQRVAPVLIQTILNSIEEATTLRLNTADLLHGIAQRARKAPIDNNYGLRQLEALRLYTAADILGRQLFTVQNSTSAYSKGLKTSFAEMDLQQMKFKELHVYKPSTNEVTSSAPLIGGLHRINYVWSKALKRPKEYRKSMMSYGQFYGLTPSMQLLQSLQGTVFTEFTTLFKRARREAFLTSMGIDVQRGLQGISSREYERIFNKVNTNLVSFLFSNPALYSGLIQNPQEYALFEERGIELMTRPHAEIEYDPTYELFNKAESLAKELTRVADEVNPTTGNLYKIDYDAIEALKPILNSSYKTPSSVIYNTTFGYKDNVNHRIAMSLAEMYYSNNTEMKSLAKKLIIYSFMTGGIVTPNSFVQFLPPALLIDMGFDQILRKMISELSKNEFANIAVPSFMVQYYQHQPFELKAQINPNKDLLWTEGTYEMKDKETGGILVEINPLRKEWFNKKYIFRIDNRLFVKVPGTNYLRMIDNLGMNKWHRNEYSYNTKNIPGTSLYNHNIMEASRAVQDGFEVKGTMTEVNIIAPEVVELQKKLETPLFEKLQEKPTDLASIIEDIQLDRTNPTAMSVLSFLKPIVQDIPVVYKAMEGNRLGQHRTDKDGNQEIVFNTNYKAFKGINSSDASQFDPSAFAEVVAHEAVHGATVKTIFAVVKGTEKNPDKVQAVERLEELISVTIKRFEQDKSLSALGKNFAKFQKLLANPKTMTPADVAFVNKYSYYQGLSVNEAGDTPIQRRYRQIAEFVAYAFTNEDFQKDLNKVNIKKNDSLWQKVLNAILEILGLKISEEQALAEVTDIKKRLTANEPYLTTSGTVDIRKQKKGISDTLKDLQPYSALHVALREIISLGMIAKQDKTSSKLESNIGRLNMNDLYSGVPNYNPEWSSDMKEAYHLANLNRQIIC